LPDEDDDDEFKAPEPLGNEDDAAADDSTRDVEANELFVRPCFEPLFLHDDVGVDDDDEEDGDALPPLILLTRLLLLLLLP
jgi:hypothetical protein